MSILQEILDSFDIEKADKAAIKAHLNKIRALFLNKTATPNDTYLVRMRLSDGFCGDFDVPIMKKILEKKYPIEYLRLFIEFNVDINRELTFYEGTPLHYCIAYGLDEQTALLLARGADYDIKNVDGFTPIMVAVDESNNVAVDQLLQYSIALKTKNNSGQTALDLAYENKNNAVANKIEEKIAAREAARRARSQPIRFSASNTAPLNAVSREAALHRTIRHK